MAVIDGIPATDLGAADRAWVQNAAEKAIETVIKSGTITGTTNSSGIVTLSQTNVILGTIPVILTAYSTAGYIVIPYTKITGNFAFWYAKVLNASDMSAVTSTSVKINYKYM